MNKQDNEQDNNSIPSEDIEVYGVFGWITALSVSIASFAGI
jgi:hypothetical protein